jgi:hypothetical protein
LAQPSTEHVAQLEQPLVQMQRSMRPLQRAANRVGRLTRRRPNSDQAAGAEEEEAA